MLAQRQEVWVQLSKLCSAYANAVYAYDAFQLYGRCLVKVLLCTHAAWPSTCCACLGAMSERCLAGNKAGSMQRPSLHSSTTHSHSSMALPARLLTICCMPGALTAAGGG